MVFWSRADVVRRTGAGVRLRRALIGIALASSIAGLIIVAATPALPPLARVLRLGIDILVGAMLAGCLRWPPPPEAPAGRWRCFAQRTGRVIAVLLAVVGGAIVVANSPDVWLRAYRVFLTIGFVALFGSGLTVKGLLGRVPALGRLAVVLILVDGIAMAALYFTADYPGWSRWADNALAAGISSGRLDVNNDTGNIWVISGGRPAELAPRVLRSVVGAPREPGCEALTFLSPEGPIVTLNGPAPLYEAVAIASCATEHGTPAQSQRAAALVLSTAAAHPEALLWSPSMQSACGVTSADETLIEVAESGAAWGRYRSVLWAREQRRVPGLPALGSDRIAIAVWRRTACRYAMPDARALLSSKRH